jgi:hypothetical protein
MDLTPKSFGAPSPPFYPTAKRTAANNTPRYPALPRSRADTEVLSAHSSIVSGLGILDGNSRSPIPLLPICNPSQPLLQSPHSWRHGNILAQNYSVSYPNMAAFSGLTSYEDVGTISAAANPDFAFSGLHSSASNPLLSLGLSRQRTSGDAMFQGFSVASDSDLHYRTTTDHKPLSKANGGLGNSSDIQPILYNLKKDLINHDSLTCQRREMDGSTTQQLSQESGNMLVELDHNIARYRVISATSHAAAPSPRPNTTMNAADAIRLRDGGRRKPGERSSLAATYECPKCGMHFTRNSNCKSHMKIHDPNRKFPHKCTMAQCGKKFGRKTDLVRHVDSVRIKPVPILR